MNELPITFKLMPLAILIGIFLVLIAVVLLFRAVGPNWLFGWCTRKAGSNFELLSRANSYAAREIIAAAMVIVVLSILALVTHLRIVMFTPTQSYGIFVLVVGVPLFIAAARSWKYIKKL